MNFLVRLSVATLLVAILTRCQSDSHAGRPISAEEVYSIIYDSVKVNEYVVLDTRSRMEYVRGHLVSAYWLSPDSINDKLSAIANEKRPIVIYDSDGRQILEVRKLLSENGVSNFYIMNGGFSDWTKRGYPAAIQLVRNTSKKVNASRKDLSIAVAQSLLSNLNTEFVLMDIRPYPAFQEGHIESALSIPYVPLNEFVVNVEQQNFSRHRPIILYCDAHSDVGEKAADVMLRNDFTQVYLLKCDLADWNAKNYQQASVN